MATTDRLLDPELRKRLEGLLQQGRSLRELAAQVGVDYQLIYKVIRSKRIRPSTERAIRRGLEQVFGGELARAVGTLLREVERELGAKRASKIDIWLRRGLRKAFQLEGRDPPPGLLKDAIPSSRRLARLQRPSADSQVKKNRR